MAVVVCQDVQDLGRSVVGVVALPWNNLEGSVYREPDALVHCWSCGLLVDEDESQFLVCTIWKIAYVMNNVLKYF